MADLIIYQKEEFGDYIVELKAWELSEGDYKYSFVLIKNEKRILGFDNHEHKGPHIHYLEEEREYDFKGIYKALTDFWQMAGEMIKNDGSND